MNSLMVVNPLLILLFSAILCVLFFRYPAVQKVISFIGTASFTIASIFLILDVYSSGIQSVQIGSWSAPFGITLVADLLSSLMVLTTSIIAICVLYYSLESVDRKRRAGGFYPIFFFMLFGICGAFLTGDIFNLYVWFEVMLVASFVLISLGNTKRQLQGSVKYVVLSLLSSGFLLMGIAILYKSAGTLNMAHLAITLKASPHPEFILLSAIFFFMSFGIKAAVFPLFSWLPASYHTPPVAIAALMSGLLTKVGVYALIRTYTLLFMHNHAAIHSYLMIVAGITMITGVLGAIAQNDIRKLLSFHIISQIGYMVMGLALFTPLALAGAIFFIIHNILVKTNLFLVSGLIKIAGGSYSLNNAGGIYDRFPAITVLFAISAASLAGIPPLSGFWGKFMLAKAGFEVQQYAIIIISLVVGLLTLFSMTKIWLKVFLPEHPQENFLPEFATSHSDITMTRFFRAKYLMVIPTVMLTLLVLIISFYAEILIGFSQKAAEQLLNPEEYVNAVLNLKP